MKSRERPIWSRSARDAKAETKVEAKHRGRRSQQERLIGRKELLLAGDAHHGARTKTIDWDRGRYGEKRGLVFSRSTGGRFSSNPATDVARWLRAKLYASQFRRPDCIVYDAAGTPIAVIDGESRARRPWPGDKT